MSRLRISATPPPTAVEFTIFTVLVRKWRAKKRSSSKSALPMMGS